MLRQGLSPLLQFLFTMLALLLLLKTLLPPGRAVDHEAKTEAKTGQGNSMQ